MPDRAEQGLPFTSVLDDLVEFRNLLNEHNIRTENTRISRYIRYLEEIIQAGGAVETNVFNDPDNVPFATPDDRLLYVLREVHELCWILKGLKIHQPKGLNSILRTIVGGSDFAAIDTDTKSRNAQFELRIASYFCQSGFAVDLSLQTDVVARNANNEFFIECKRVYGSRKLRTRIDSAKKQLRKRLSRNTLTRKCYGVIAVDVTKLAFSKNGLTLGVTAEHGRDVVREQLSSVSSQVTGSNWIPIPKKILLLWLQVHIPVAVQHPLQCATRFSSLFLENRLKNSRNKIASSGLKDALEISNVGDDREVEGKELEIREEIVIPKNTTIDMDEELIDDVISGCDLPELPFDKVVMTLVLPSGSTHIFTFFDLKSAVGLLSASDRTELQKSKENSLGIIMGMLIKTKYPYISDTEDFQP